MPEFADKLLGTVVYAYQWTGHFKDGIKKASSDMTHSCPGMKQIGIMKAYGYRFLIHWGDWLVTYPDGCTWPLMDNEFRSRFQKIGDQS